MEIKLMLFKNVKTGSELVATNETTIALMRDSDTFIEVTEKPKKTKKPKKPTTESKK